MPENIGFHSQKFYLDNISFVSFGNNHLNKWPVANAGGNRVVDLNGAFTLDGSGSFDPDNGPMPLSISWKQIINCAYNECTPTATITGANTLQPTIQIPPVTSKDYKFVLTLNDGVVTSTDTVTVINGSDCSVIYAINYKPGEGLGYHDLTPGNEGGLYRNDNVDIQSSQDTGWYETNYNVGSIDPGEWLSYDFYVGQSFKYTPMIRIASGVATTKSVNISIDNGPATTINFTSANGWESWETVSATAPVSLTKGNHVLRLTALTGGFNLNWLRLEQIANQPPIANAGHDKVANINETVTLDGSGSYDPDSSSSALMYSWLQNGGPTVELTANQTANPSFTPVEPGKYVFKLMVSDGFAISFGEVSVVAGDYFTLNVAANPANGGSVTGSGSYVSGSTISVAATPSNGYEFTGWSGDLTGAVNSTTITMNNNKSVIANFTPQTGLTLVAPKGATASNVENSNYAAGMAIDNITTTRWSSQFSDPQWIVFDMGSAKRISTVVLDWEGANAKNYVLEGSNDQSFATKTTLVTKVNMASVNHRIDSLSGLSGSYQYYRMYGTARNLTYGYSIYEARFYTSGSPTTYSIVASAGANGTISPAGNVSVNAGASQAFTITPNSGYVIDAVTVDGVSQGINPSYTFNNLVANHTISVTFKLVTVTYSIVASAGANGTISPAGNVSVNAGASQAFTIRPSGDYVIDAVIVDGVSQGINPSYTFNNVAANHSISVTFKIIGNYITLPGRFQAEDYKVGGEGTGYHDLTSGNTGGAYKPNDNVDIEVTSDVNGGLYNVGWADNGEWLAYDVNVTMAGTYKMSVRVASGLASTKTLSVTVDGNPLTTISTAVNNGWQGWSDVASSNFNLTAGNHVLRVTTSGSLNLNYFDVSLSTTTNLITNGDFSNGGTNWLTGGTSFGTVSYSGGMADWTINSASSQAWELQMMQSISLVAGRQYTLCFDIRTDESTRAIAVGVNGDADNNYADRGLNQTINVTPSWVTQSFTFTANATDASSRLDFNMGANANDVMIDNVRLVEGVSCN
jgi:uncharacterized repeat protein (TIGR02543 family)